jgi:hypothetical protein
MPNAENSWHSYPSIYALGHRYITDLLLDPVLVEEKIDGSQFSFGVFTGDNGPFLRCRSKGCELNIIAPDNMFKRGVEVAQALQDKLHVGWTYRAEYLMKPKHNALAYDRIPKDHIIIFDINDGHESYLSYEQKAEEAARLGLEVVPKMYEGRIEDIQHFRSLLDTVSCLGGQKIEGVVIKNYSRFGLDKKVLLGKFVSEAFKEVHAREWKAANPTQNDIVQQLVESLKTPARWNKAIQHLREAGQLEDSPRDIGLLIKEIPADIEKEETDYIKQKLFDWAWPHIRRGVVGGMPEWYKEQLLKKQFEVTHAER